MQQISTLMTGTALCSTHTATPSTKQTNNAHKNAYRVADIRKFLVNMPLLALAVILLMFILPNTANAHRGAKGEVDTCRVSIGKEVVHFSAYTPRASGGRSFCHAIPNVELTHLVIDYEGKKLRHTTVEFEVTKEPEGTRIFYQKPEMIKKGSINVIVDFSQYGAGDYLTHISLVNQNETIDAHLPFSVGVVPEEDKLPYKIIIPFILVIIILISMKFMTVKKGPEAD
jgi:hypothetical protein